jgi:hypothetical protein
VSIRRWLARHRMLLFGSLLYVAFAPAALFAFPLAALLTMSRLRTVKEAMTLAIAGGFSLAWLLDVGSLPDQVVRAGVVLATAVFVLLTRYSARPVICRSLAAVAVTTLTVAGLLLALGSSWGELRWWVAHEASLSVRFASQMLWITARDGSSAAAELAALVADSVRYAADYFPAVLALQLIAGLALATAIYMRVTEAPHGPGLDRFARFRFNENIGWVAIPPLLVILIPMLAAARVGATNLLIVLGVLYALRGASVIAFGLQLVGASSRFMTVVVVVGAFLILPVAVAGAILLGIVDSGLDLRRRWSPPPAS